MTDAGWFRIMLSWNILQIENIYSYCRVFRQLRESDEAVYLNRI